ncbi:MAG TPA: hypothetical protein VIW67_09855 [Terriglobales bacterium]|jgi:hypothetical protein
MGSVIGGRTHTFHADASAFGGHIEQPFEKIIASQAPLTLSPDGGYTAARVDNFRLEGLFSFRSAYTQVSGIVSKKRPGWTTLATSVIEGLNIAEILTVDRVVAQIITEHPAEMGKYAPSVNFVGTRFDNLRVGSCVIEVDLNLDLCKPEKADVHGYPDKHTLEDSHFIQRLKDAGQYNSAGGDKTEVQCSLFEKATIKGKLPGTLEGNVLTIPGFGKATLAELIVDANFYRLSMLGLQLGSPTRGGVSAGVASGNGSSQP